MEGMRSEPLGAPGGRNRYPMTMRKVKLETAMDASANIRTSGIMVRGRPSYSGAGALIEPAGTVGVFWRCKTELNLFMSDPRDG